MPNRTIIALDTMGGDDAPEVVVAGAALARATRPSLHFLLYGNESAIKPLMDRHSALRGCCEIRHTPDVIGATTKPSAALRQGRNSSMRLAVNAVHSGEATSVVSAGNTGALMAIAKLVLRPMTGIDRPAIATLIPNRTGESVLLDMGANLECDAENLVQFAMMGAIFCRAVRGIACPSVGLLNIGAEEMKGHDELRAAAAILRERPMPGRFHGFIEGDDVMAGTVDVVVTDGFSGNIALKAVEGTARTLGYFLEQSFRSSWTANLGYLLARSALRQLKTRIDPRRYNGAMFLGLQGVCVKSHGGTDALGFANAINVAFDLTNNHFNERIHEELVAHYGLMASSEEDADISGDYSADDMQNPSALVKQ